MPDQEELQASLAFKISARSHWMPRDFQAATPLRVRAFLAFPEAATPIRSRCLS